MKKIMVVVLAGAVLQGCTSNPSKADASRVPSSIGTTKTCVASINSTMGNPPVPISLRMTGSDASQVFFTSDLADTSQRYQIEVHYIQGGAAIEIRDRILNVESSIIAGFLKTENRINMQLARHKIKGSVNSEFVNLECSY